MINRPFDMSNKIMKKHLHEIMKIPYVDVDIALATLQPIQITNSHWYDKKDAAKAIEHHYMRRIAENQSRYASSHAEIYHKREMLCTERLERVHAYMAELEREVTK